MQRNRSCSLSHDGYIGIQDALRRRPFCYSIAKEILLHETGIAMARQRKEVT
jgi:hypothetical protein